MNQSALKNYAPQARLDFIQAVKDRAAFFGLTPESRAQIQETGDVVIIGGQAFPKVVASQRRALLERINKEGYEAVMEAMAYTWFNRFVALRFMEVHGYLDHGYRVLSHPSGKPNPEILDHAERVTLPGLDPQQVIQLKLDGNRDAELYRLLLVAQCNALHQAIPFVFGKIADETELLLPDNLLHSNSVIRRLVNSIDESDWQEVEVLGWLYQFYISDKKDAVMARKSAVPTEDIPAVTQLFTPHWIVRYLVENSLGRLWLLNRPTSRLKEHMPYYIEGEPETDFLKIAEPEEINLCDPACGSGHMLTYAFDLLCLIYEEEGYAPTEIPGLILRHNLHGLEICPRAAQLAEMALIFKARAKSRRFFQPEHLVRPHIIELRDVRFAENELRDYIHALGLGDLFNQPVLKLLHQFEEAKNFGSLIQPCLDERTIAEVRKTLTAHWSLPTADSSGQLFLRETHLNVLRVLEQAEALTQRYHIVVANPPYMGGSTMNKGLATFARKHYANGKSDFMTMFLERSFTLSPPNALIAFITLDSWLFLSSFENLRRSITTVGRTTTLLHIGWNCFPYGHLYNRGVTFVFKNSPNPMRGHFLNLSDAPATVDKETLFLIRKASKEYHFNIDQAIFSTLPGCVYAYGISSRVHELLVGANLATLGEAKRGLQPGDVVAMVRSWWEISNLRMETKASTRPEAMQSKMRWFKFDNGGPVRKWFGNNTNVVDWESNGHRIKSGPNPIVPSEHLYFEEGFVWSRLTSSSPSFRLHDGGTINGDLSPCFFPHKKDKWILALLNSNCSRYLLATFSPTLTFLVSDVLKLPSCEEPEGATEVVERATALARADWDDFETSWDFCDLPLLRRPVRGDSLEMSWQNWEAQSAETVHRLQKLETENNRLFISIYGLGVELRPEVPKAQITLFCNPANRYKKNAKKRKISEEESGDAGHFDRSEEELCYPPEQLSAMFRGDTVRDFISYAVGCMMGRYSLDKPGLVYADSRGIGFDPSQYRTFAADADGIVPVTELAWFSDDATERIIEFLGKTFAPGTLEANLKFLAEALVPTKDETPRDTVRRYLAAGFYKDHLQTYKRRPIYWLFSSGKQRAFQCLVYLHRYNEGTLARMRTEYVIPLQGKISHRIDQLAGDITAATSTSHRKKLEKERDSLVKQATELANFDEKLRHYADQRIALDLDDGVKVNYAKFGDLLAEAKSVTGGTEE